MQERKVGTIMVFGTLIVVAIVVCIMTLILIQDTLQTKLYKDILLGFCGVELVFATMSAILLYYGVHQKWLCV